MANSREIRFRAWDKENKEMVDMQHLRSLLALFNLNNVGTSTFIPLQFTGLKDKNGVEIYEGDIVYFNQGLSLGGANSLGQYEQTRLMDGTRSVVWKDKGFDWNGEHSGLMFCKGGECFYEVIGNVYEHPELLAKQTEVL